MGLISGQPRRDSGWEMSQFQSVGLAFVPGEASLSSEASHKWKKIVGLQEKIVGLQDLTPNLEGLSKNPFPNNCRKLRGSEGFIRLIPEVR